MRDDLTTPLVTDALDMAIEQRKPERVIHHSDRGSQYTSAAFRARCEQAGIAVSMGRRGDAYDMRVYIRVWNSRWGWLPYDVPPTSGGFGVECLPTGQSQFGDVAL